MHHALQFVFLLGLMAAAIAAVINPKTCENGPKCPEGQECYMQTIYCLVAPCPPPYPACRPIPSCENAPKCPDGQECYMETLNCFVAPCPPPYPACIPIQE